MCKMEINDALCQFLITAYLVPPEDTAFEPHYNQTLNQFYSKLHGFWDFNGISIQFSVLILFLQISLITYLRRHDRMHSI